MKNFKCLVAALALVLGLAACENDPEFDNKITLGKSEVSIASDGAAVTVGYMVENPIEGEKISVEYDADWLTVSTERARTIELSATINDTGADRSEDLIISYRGAKSVTLRVMQQCYNAPFTIEILEVGATTLSAMVTTEDNMTWLPLVESKEYVDYYMAMGEEALFQDDIAYLEYTAENSEITLEELLSEILVTGSDQVDYARLTPDTEYVLYLYGLTPEGQRTTSIVCQEFKTTPAHTGDITFQFDVTEKNYRIDFTITPSHTGVPYYFGVASENEINEWMTTYDTTDLQTAIQKGDIDASITYFIDEMGWYDDVKEFYDYWTETDVMDYGWINADADTKYIFYAAKWNEDCKFSGALSTYEYTTPPVSMSDNVITLSVSELTQSSVCVSTTTTNDDPYVVFPIKSSEIVGMDDSGVIAHLKNKYDYTMSLYTYEGDVSDEVYSRMRPDTEYTLLCFGYIAGTQTTAMERYEFSTLPSGDPAECTFEVSVLPNAEDAWVEIVPSDKGHFYHWAAYPVTYTEFDAKLFISEIVNFAYEGDYAAFASWELSQGNVAASIYDLYPMTEYKIGLVVMNYDNFEYLSDVVFSEPFTTPDFVYADIDITLNYGPYYDLEELVAAGETQFQSLLLTNDALFTVDIELEGDYSAFYYDIWSRDLTDSDSVTGYPDAMFYEALYEGSTYESTNFFVSYGKDMTIVAIAYDLDGNPSIIKRELVHFTKEGTSSVEDYFANKPAAAPQRAAVAKESKWGAMPVVAPKQQAQRCNEELAVEVAAGDDTHEAVSSSREERIEAQRELRRANRGNNKPTSLRQLPM